MAILYGLKALGDHFPILEYCILICVLIYYLGFVTLNNGKGYFICYCKRNNMVYNVYQFLECGNVSALVLLNCSVI